MSRRERGRRGAAALGIVGVLAGFLVSLAGVVAPAAPASATASPSGTFFTSTLQNTAKSTFLGRSTYGGQPVWVDTATTGGLVTYPAPGQSGIVSIEGTCIALAAPNAGGYFITIPVGDGSGCIKFDSVVTGAGTFTFQTNIPGDPFDNRYLGDGDGGGILDLLSTTPLMTFRGSIPTITDPLDNALLSTDTPVLKGTGDPGATIDVTDSDGNSVCTPKPMVESDRSWTCTTTSLSDGSTVLTPHQTDTSDNTTPGIPITVVVDTTPPAAPVMSEPADGDATNDLTPTFSGTGENGDTVTITDEDDNVICDGVVAGGKWTCTPTDDIALGDHTFTPTAKDPAGHETGGDPATVTFDTTPPAAPTMSSPAAGDEIKDATPTFSGTGDDGDTVAIVDENGDTVCEATVADGKWSCTPDDALDEGDHTFTPTSKDKAGNETPGTPVDVKIDTTAPDAPVITSPANGDATNETTPTFSGTGGDDGDVVTIVDENGDSVCEGTVSAGQWSCTPTTPLEEGDHTFTPTSKDKAGNETSGTPVDVSIDATAPTPPVMTSPKDGDATSDTTPTFTGTGDNGDTVTVTDQDGNVICSDVVSGGTWTCTPTTALDEGDYTFTPTSKDPAGNEIAGDPVDLTVDTTAPDAPAVTSPADGDSVKDATPTFEGTGGDDGDVVTVVDEDGNTVCEATVTDGNWSCTPTTPIGEGDHTFTPTSKDKAGNETPGTPVDVTVDTTPPAAPVMGSPGDGAAVGDDRPTFEGTGGDDGDTVTIVDEDGNTVCETTVSGGAWSCTPTTPIDEGDHTFTPISKDEAGNETPGTPVDVTVDTTPPDAPVVTGPADGDSVNDTTPTFEGTGGDDGDVVTVVDENGDTVCEATVADGKWSCTPTTPIGEGDHTFTPTSKDKAGNETPGTPVDVTVDTTAPTTVPVVTSPADGDSVKDGTPTFTGTGGDGDTVTITDEDGNVVCSVLVTAGQWSCTPGTAIPDGDHTFTPTSSDDAGNTTAGDPVKVTVDTEAPTAPKITGPKDGDSVNDTTPTFEGTGGDDGDVVTVVDENGDTVCEATVADGKWSCTPTTPIGEGDHTFTPTSKDEAGNTTDGDSVDVKVDTTKPDAPGDVKCSTNPDKTVTCEGTGTPGDTVDVVDDNGDTVCSVEIGDDGKWTCTSEKPVEAFPVKVIEKDPAGNESDPVVTPTPPTITSPTDGKPISDSTPKFEGTGNDGDTVKVVDENGDTICETTVADGKWSCTPDKAIGDGEHTFTPIVVGDDGTESAGAPVKTTIDTDAPKTPGDVECSVNPDKTVTCSGTGEPGDTADVRDDNGDTICSVVIGDDGKWTCTSEKPVTDFPLSVVIKDPAGNESDPVTIPAPPGDIRCSTNADHTVTCEGTGKPGDKVEVTDGDGNKVCSVTVGKDGKWSCTSDGPVKNPPLTVTITDGDGTSIAVPGVPVAGAEPEPGNGGGGGGSDLPRTGFTGTGIAIGGGIVVLLGAGALLLTRRRKR